MSEVHQIRAAALEPDAHAIECAETLLALAKSGELRGIAYIGYLTNSETKYGVCGAEMSGNRLRTYGLLHWLANRVLAMWDESAEEIAPE